MLNTEGCIRAYNKYPIQKANGRFCITLYQITNSILYIYIGVQTVTQKTRKNETRSSLVFTHPHKCVSLNNCSANNI